MDKLDEILTRLQNLEELCGELFHRFSDSVQTQTSGSKLDDKVLAVFRENPTRWFQPKTILETRKVQASNQAIGSACSRLVSRGLLEMELKSTINRTVPEAHLYDPKMYRLKEQ